MSYRFMRVIIFFDLPINTSKNKRDYRIFRKNLLKMGFLMMQESVYSKLVVNSTMADTVIENIKKNKPSEGIVQALKVTEKQFSKMELIVGNVKSDIINTDDKLIIL